MRGKSFSCSKAAAAAALIYICPFQPGSFLIFFNRNIKKK
jgi:hypothetical protein